MTGSEDPGPVRPYVITGGRVEPARARLALETLVIATDAPVARTGIGPEALAIRSLCRKQLSVAEVAAHLRQPLTVVMVLLEDLLDAGLVQARPPVPVAAQADRALLREVLDGLRGL